MTSLPHISDPEAIPRMLRLVQNTTTPGRVTAQHLRSNGFNTVDGAHLVGLLRAIRFVDNDSHPTKHWKDYRSNRTAPKVLAKVVRDAYEPLFKSFSEPAERSDDEIAVAIRQFTNFDEQHVQQTVSSFRALCTAAGLVHTDSTSKPAARRRDRPAADVSREVAGLSALSLAEFDAADRALSHRLHRAAHVAAWNGFVALALMHLARDDFRALRTVLPKWSGSSAEELGMRTTGRGLIDILVELKLVANDQEFSLAELLQRRNDCAHPTTFAPTTEQTTAYLDEVIEHALALAQRPKG